jgi:hypothetical protein
MGSATLEVPPQYIETLRDAVLAEIKTWRRATKRENPSVGAGDDRGTALIGCIAGLAVLPIGFVWNLPLLTVVAGFGFVLGLAWLDGVD